LKFIFQDSIRTYPNNVYWVYCATCYQTIIGPLKNI